uniref:NADH-ubiquinone oxidoreductase chain 2 n=1 Tax=Trichocera bimacula TaxID=174634 RepID=G8J8H7_9DIPT|nr:NADH dehydrogenase subunit 2 [Trichocera bimacula]AET13095.1 NADH dehydrogenase subunit 2 [Trichocera bimacula]
MFKNSAKLLFFLTLISSTMIVVSSNSWLGAWIGLEINLLSFIPLMINTNNLMTTEASLKYFLTQALASSILLFAILMSMMSMNLISQFNFNQNYSSVMINSALLLKTGAAPFHFWFPEVMEGLSWMNNLILMTWQKIAPLMLISYCFSINFMSVVIILSVMIGSLSGLNQTSLRKIMAFSSINHLGWLIAAMLMNENMWFMYFCLYSFLSMTIIFTFNMLQIFHINQAFSLKINYPLLKFCLFTSFLSLGGLPPFLGFMPKWLVIQSLVSSNQIFLVVMMVCLTLITLFFYLRICFSAFMLNYTETIWNFKMNYNNLNLSVVMTLSFISIFGLLGVSMFYLII